MRVTPGVPLAPPVLRVRPAAAVPSIDSLRQLGLQAGLAALGVTSADTFDQTRQVLEQRKADGLAGGMQFTYRNPTRSTDPSRILPGARSVLVGARSYLRHDPPPSGDRGDGLGHSDGGPGPSDAPGVTARVARYAWVDHYQPLRQALGVVAQALEAAGWRARVLADDNALVDRAAAARAGIGWYGKNCNILLPGAGSWFVLGSVVTDAPLTPDPPLSDGCGACARCLSACPTGALVAPGVLDARRCLAWLVQAPGVFPIEHRVALGDRLYGCDDCQEVCPPNRRAARHPLPAAEAGAQVLVDVLELLTLSDEELLGRHGRWYIPQRNPRYLRRNALIVLGNVGASDDPRVLAALRRYLEGPDPLLRSHALWSAARLGRPELVQIVAGDSDPGVRQELNGLHRILRRDGSAPEMTI